MKIVQLPKKEQAEIKYSEYKTWDCVPCGRSYFYSVVNCPICQTGKITEMSHPTLGFLKSAKPLKIEYASRPGGEVAWIRTRI